MLNEAGIQPDIILGRSQVPLDEPRKKKISVFCNVTKEDVISAPDVSTIYEIPINFEKENLGNQILKKFKLKAKKNNLRDWKELVEVIKRTKRSVKIGMVGKYFETGDFTLMDSYISVIEAIKHASWVCKRKPQIEWISSEKYERDPKTLKELKDNLKESDVIPEEIAGELNEVAAYVKSFLDQNNRTRIFIIRFMAAIIGCFLTWQSEFYVFQILAKDPTSKEWVGMLAGLNQPWINILVGGCAAAAGSSYWHDQLDKVRNLKAAVGNLKALKQ